MPLTHEDVQQALLARFRRATLSGDRWLIVEAGDLHKEIGASNRVPMCCGAMVAAMLPGDTVVKSPPSGHGSSLTILYWLPRRDGGVGQNTDR